MRNDSGDGGAGAVLVAVVVVVVAPEVVAVVVVAVVAEAVVAVVAAQHIHICYRNQLFKRGIVILHLALSLQRRMREQLAENMRDILGIRHRPRACRSKQMDKWCNTEHITRVGVLVAFASLDAHLALAATG